MLSKMINHLGKAMIVAACMTLSAPTFAADKIKVGLSSHGLLFIPAFVADVMGYYKDEGFDADLLRACFESS